MPHLSTYDDVKLYYEETGSGSPVVFVHEFAGDCASWEPQVRVLSRRHRCITYNARGFPPSDVPGEQSRYSQDRARDDVLLDVRWTLPPTRGASFLDELRWSESAQRRGQASFWSGWHVEERLIEPRCRSTSSPSRRRFCDFGLLADLPAATT